MDKNYIRAWRKKRNLTQQELASRMEFEPGVELMSYATVSNIERGAQSPTLAQLNALAEALDVTVGMLIESDPDVDGEVIDLLRRIDDKNRDMVIAVLQAALGKAS